MRPTQRPARATCADLAALPEHLVGEILDGELVVSPRPGILHARAASDLGVTLGGAFGREGGGPGGFWILDEPELHLGSDVLVPELAGWRRERLPRLPAAAFLELAPDWVCEVLSPSTQTVDRVRKLRLYGRAGVAHAWLLDPIARYLEVFRFTGEGIPLRVEAYQGAESVRAEPFDAIELDLRQLWDEPDAPAGGAAAMKETLQRGDLPVPRSTSKARRASPPPRVSRAEMRAVKGCP